MPKYIGQSCTSCQEKFTEKDDIVVCPDCGSPYHRECYEKEGKCISADLHSSGEDWKPEVIIPERPKTDDPHEHIREDNVSGSHDEAFGSYQEEYRKNLCPLCGQENRHDDSFCSRCGSRLNLNSANTDSHSKNICPVCKLENRPNDVFCARCGAPLDKEKATSRPGFGSFTYGQPIRPDSNIDGNTVDEYTRYVGSRFFYFVPRFLNFSKYGTKMSFNFSAFMFPHVYFLYRKMYPLGIFTLVLTILLNVPTLISEFAVSGFLPMSLIESNGFLTIYYLCSFLSTVLSVACGMFANWLYYKKAKSDIDKIKGNVLEVGQQKLEIAGKGGTSMVAVLAAFTVSLVVYFAAIWLIATTMAI